MIVVEVEAPILGVIRGKFANCFEPATVGGYFHADDIAGIHGKYQPIRKVAAVLEGEMIGHLGKRHCSRRAFGMACDTGIVGEEGIGSDDGESISTRRPAERMVAVHEELHATHRRDASEVVGLSSPEPGMNSLCRALTGPSAE